MEKMDPLYNYHMVSDPYTRMVFSGKIGRNDPCPCGSGRKYKNCHLAQSDTRKNIKKKNKKLKLLL